MVSLPKDWVQEVNLKSSDVVSIKREDDGSLNIIPVMGHKEEKRMNWIVNSDLCNSPNLLTRVITGNYILGHDTIRIVAKNGLKKVHLEEIRATTQRLTGLTIVEQTIKQITLQSFIDPTRFPVYGLMSRLYFIMSSMLEASMKGLMGRPSELAEQVSHMEEESDRIYWLIIRQLLLAIRDRSMGWKIGMESPFEILGNRVVAKTLEEMADSAEKIAVELLALKNSEIWGETIVTEIGKFAGQVDGISEQSMRALLTGDIDRANEALETMQTAAANERRLTNEILMCVKNVGVAVRLRTIVWNLGQIAKYSRTIGEVTINRIMEKPSQIAHVSVLEARST